MDQEKLVKQQPQYLNSVNMNDPQVLISLVIAVVIVLFTTCEYILKY